MRQTFRLSLIASAIAATVLAGCGTVEKQSIALESSATRSIHAEQEKAALPVPVITTTPAAWLMGQSVQVTPPPPPILTQRVIYHPTQRVTLSDVASWVTQSTGLIVDTAEVQSTDSGNSQDAKASTFGHSGPVGPIMPAFPSTTGASAGAGLSSSPLLLSISYEGTLSGLLDIVANKAGVWGKMSDGSFVFYRTETKTFYLPAIARISRGSSLIAADSGSSGSAGGGTGSSTSGTSSGTSSGGATSSSEYEVDVWAGLGKAAKIVGGSAQVVASPSVGSLTVTGTPTQVRNVENWVKSLADNLSQQVAISVHVYRIRVAKEDNYNWNPSVVFSSLSAKYGFTLTGPQTPAVVSGLAPLNLVANVLETATGGAAKYSGSQLALQALSTLGHVSETVQQTVVTLNGQPAPIQIANRTSYLASTTMGAPTTIGAAPVPPTLTPGTITTGFTAMFLPRVVNGKILLSMNLTSSTLVGIGSVSSGGSSIQTPNVDISTFQQSVSLTPGDALLLTGLQQDSGKASHSGVGSPNNFAFGGGIDANTDKQLIAIVISAKVL